MRAALFAILLLIPLQVQAEPPTPTLSLTGQGQVAVTPDIATISIGVESQQKTAGAALSENNAQAGAVITALKQAGVEPRDIQTSNFSVRPVYADRKTLSQGAPKVVGYRVFNQVLARIRVLDDLGGILDQVVSTGANRIGGISFGLAEDGDARDEARKRAVADARRKAELYAAAAGVTLGPVLSISEAGHQGGPRPMMMEARSAAAVPIEAGTSTIAASVMISWQISGP
ncbi:MAG: SIMPL domain-containing protein [Paracoccaceae bacterium]